MCVLIKAWIIHQIILNNTDQVNICLNTAVSNTEPVLAGTGQSWTNMIFYCGCLLGLLATSYLYGLPAEWICIIALLLNIFQMYKNMDNMCNWLWPNGNNNKAITSDNEALAAGPSIVFNDHHKIHGLNSLITMASITLKHRFSLSIGFLRKNYHAGCWKYSTSRKSLIFWFALLLKYLGQDLVKVYM